MNEKGMEYNQGIDTPVGFQHANEAQIIIPAADTVRMQKKVVFAFLYILVFPALLLLLSGDVYWPEGWVFSLWFILLCYSTILYLYQKDPALLEERYRQPGTGNQQRWDRYVVYGLVAGFITWIVIMPLDAQRFGWSPVFPAWVKVLGIAGLAGSFFLFFRSYTDNTFLSPLVRIQEDRKQRVVSTGVYGFVRHPMYLGGIFMFTGSPLLLGSMYGLFAGLALTALLMARIQWEEAMLARDLEGYPEYMQKVRYRLIPCIW
jgi:protein-S-isoprenylcysteine O-methyltransferase Ste14